MKLCPSIVLAGDSDSDQKTKQVGKRGNEAPSLPADTLGVHEQKTMLTAIQFVIILGICPILVSGVGFASRNEIRICCCSERLL